MNNEGSIYWGHFRVAPIVCFKARLSAKRGIHYHKKGFALGVGLKVRVLELGSGIF